MKLRLEHHGIIFEYEKKLIPKSRFKAMCAIACILAYIALVSVDGDSLASFLGLLLCGGVCAGILTAPDKD